MSRILNHILTSPSTVANKIINRSYWYDVYWGGVTKFWRINTFDYDVVNLGSNSGKYAFSYNIAGIKGMNWAVGPQSLLHDFDILKNYFSYLKDGASIIIPICPFSSLSVKYSKQSNLKYYTFLHPATIVGFDEKERLKALLIKNNPLKYLSFKDATDIWKLLLKTYIKRSFHKNNFVDSANYYIEMWKRQFCIDDLDAPLSGKKILDKEYKSTILSDMLDFCIERGFKPIIVIPPMHYSLAEKLSPEFRENYIYSFIRRANQHDVPFYDFIDDKRFHDDKYFRNAYFMSDLGARCFSEIFLKEIL